VPRRPAGGDGGGGGAKGPLRARPAAADSDGPSAPPGPILINSMSR
jgi:hypothetical protein